jgi:Replication protein
MTETIDYGLAELLLLRDRLAAEGEDELLTKLSKCQEPLILKCGCCSDTLEVRQQCRRKWCPCCARQLAARRTQELNFVVARFRWPLFVTLTMRNVADLSSGGVRHLRRSFGKLRHRKLWKSCVRGGIATCEVTNIGNGWHPHLHCVVDCKWLGSAADAPARSDSQDELRQKFTKSAQQLEQLWAKTLRQSTASVKVKRANRDTIAKEVVKYTVKGQDLLDCHEPIGDLIRALDSTRMMTTFGTAHGQCVKEVRQAAKLEAARQRLEFLKDKQPRCFCGGEEWSLDHDKTHDAQRDARLRALTPRGRVPLRV